MSGIIFLVAIALTMYFLYVGIKRNSQGRLEFAPTRIITAIGIIGVAIFLTSMITQIPGSETGVITNFGQYTNRTLPPGLNFKAPWEGVIVVNTSVQALKQQKSDAFTSDKQHAYTDFAVNFTIRPESAPEVLRKYQGEIDTRIIEPRVEFWLKDIEPKYSATDLINKRVEVAKAVQQHIEADLKDKGVDVIGVYITNISFGEQYQKASESLAAAQQDLAHEQIELKIREVKAQQVVADAQGQGKANKLIRDSLPQNPQQADAIVRLRLVNLLETKWDGSMPSALGGGSILSIGDSGAKKDEAKTK